MKKSIFFLAALMALSACKTVKTPDGTIPSEYLEQAKQYEGVYTGTFDRTRGTLILSFEGNRPVLTFAGDNASSDILGGQCQSKIGDLIQFGLKQDGDKSYSLASAVFAFDANRCIFVEGRTLDLSFRMKDGKQTVSASILRRVTHTPTCSPTVIHNPDGSVSVGDNCRTNTEFEYMYGRFGKKTN